MDSGTFDRGRHGSLTANAVPGSTLACSGVFWRVLACSGVFWRVLACSGVFLIRNTPMSVNGYK